MSWPEVFNALPVELMDQLIAVLAVDEMPMSAGLEYERGLFHSLFATEDQKEGMMALLEKRAPNFTGE